MRVDNEASRAPTETIARRTIVKSASLTNDQLHCHMVACARRRIRDHTHADGTLVFSQDLKPTLLPWTDAHAIDVARHRVQSLRKPDPLQLDSYGAYMDNHVGDYAMAYSHAILDYVSKDFQALAFSMACLPFRTREQVVAYNARKYA